MPCRTIGRLIDGTVIMEKIYGGRDKEEGNYHQDDRKAIFPGHGN